MDVRNFEAHTMREALKAVKSTFGSDAVILNTERVSESGANFIRIRATGGSSQGQQSQTMNRPNNQSSHLNTAGFEESLFSMGTQIKSLEEKLASRDQLDLLEGSLDELKLLLLEGQKDKTLKVSEGLCQSIQDIERQLRLTNVEDTYTVEMIKYLRNLPGPGEIENDRRKMESEKEYYQNASIKWALKRIKIAPKWTVNQGSVAIHAFLGATGVGKSSLVAKLASHYSRNENAKVLVVSFDNLRVAASEQMRILTKAMNVSFATLSSPEDLPDLIEKNEETELVLIDTAGRSTKSKLDVDGIEALCELPLPIEKHLVLSMSEKQIQMDRSIRFFSKMGINSLMFSKLDQTWSYGEMFNVMNRWNLPASFFSVGQAIPKDFERASRERVVERIFGL